MPFHDRDCPGLGTTSIGRPRNPRMSVDPRLIRSEQHAEIGTVLRRDASLVVERWRQRALREQPHAARVHHETLLDHLPTFLWELGGSLAETQESDNGGH